MKAVGVMEQFGWMSSSVVVLLGEIINRSRERCVFMS